MVGLVQKHKGIVRETGVKLYYDRTINKGTRGLFDMAVSAFGSAKNLAAGEVITDLTFNELKGSFVKAKTYANGGMTYAGVSADYFEIPAAAVPLPADKHWLFTVWAKITDPGNSGFNNQTLNIGVAGNNVGSGTVLGIIQTVTSGAVSQVQFRVNAVNYTLGSVMFPFYDGNVHQLGIEYQKNADSTQQRIIAYIDKVAVYTSPWGNVAAAAPAIATQRIIGTSGTFPKAWGGLLYRTRLDDLAQSGLTAQSVLNADYDRSRTRFS